MSISERISQGRKALGLTEQQFADAVGVSRGAVQQWERGLTAPKRKNQAAVARKLGLTVAQLMAEDGENYSGAPTPSARAVKEPTATHAVVDASLLRAQKLLSQLSPDGLKEALSYLEWLTEKEKKGSSRASRGGPLPGKRRNAV